MRCPIRRVRDGRPSLLAEAAAAASPDPPPTPTSTTASSNVQEAGGEEAQPQEPRHAAKVSAAEAPVAPERGEAPADEEERICRYCFEGEEAGELISPCRCAGGQKYVHLSCLRAWQRTVLVSQPTHPDYYDADTRQRVCNVCKAEFTCPPPTRAELLASFAGQDVAALIEEGCLIASAEDFSWELHQQVMSFPTVVRDSLVYRNWVRGAFLIVKVIEDRGRDCVFLRVNDEDGLQRFLDHVGDDLRTFHLRGRRFSVLFQGALRDFPEGDDEEAVDARRVAARDLRVPLTVRLRPEADADRGEDGVVAVNLTRPFDLARGRLGVDRHRRAAWSDALEDLGATSAGPRATVSHFIAGPCEEERPSACLLVSGGACRLFRDGDCLLLGLRAAEALASGDRRAASVAMERAAPGGTLGEAWAAALLGADDEEEDEHDEEGEEEDGGGGDDAAAAVARVAADDADAHDNGYGDDDDNTAAADEPRLTSAVPAESTASAHDDAAGSHPDGQPEAEGGDAAASAAGNAREAEAVRLLVFWGYAGWSRCQLLGEIARGSWGLCRGQPGDVTATPAREVWRSVYPRLVFAPRSEMSETYGGRPPLDQAIVPALASPDDAAHSDSPVGNVDGALDHLDSDDEGNTDDYGGRIPWAPAAEEPLGDNDDDDDESSGLVAPLLRAGRRTDEE